ncbi:OmpA family protein [Paracoccus sp. p3-h83]|uniref:OmpA family protein n=1 Tax=Paracoccus sp. p3-h83 TaxID=3342805 RepID=UPI0035B8EDCE
MTRIAVALMMTLLAGAAQAEGWPLPGQAEPSAEVSGSGLRLATGPWGGASVPGLRADGAARHRAWRITGDGGLPPAGLIAPIRDALRDQGYEILYECADQDCGGFDFRFALPVMAEPGMHVDLGRFRYLSARAGDRLVAVWASRAPEAGFVQISEGSGPASVMALLGGVPMAPVSVMQDEGEPAAEVPADPPAETPKAAPAAGDLFATGALVLAGVDFAPNAPDIADPKAPVLAQLADWLRADPGRALVLVGHTDATGSLAANIAVSQRRAEAVRRHLIEDHGIAPDRITAEGAGWLAPRATNTTEAGRAANRRVEALPR